MALVLPWRSKSRSEDVLLQQLRELLSAHSAPKQPKGKGKGPSVNDNSKKGKGKGNEVKPSPQKGKGKEPPPKVGAAGNDLLGALKRIVARADKNPAGLLQRLGTIVSQATAGKNLRPTRADRRVRARAKKATDGGKGKHAKDTSTTPASTQQRQSSWVEVAKKGNKTNAAPVPWRLDSDKGKVINAATAQKLIQSEDTFTAQWIQAKNSQEAQRLLDIARVHECKAKVGVVFEGAADKGAQKQFPSVNGKGQKTVRSWNVLALGSAGLPDDQDGFVLKSTFQAPTRQLRLLRVSIPKMFVEPSSWKEVANHPEPYLRKMIEVPWHSRDRKSVV